MFSRFRRARSARPTAIPSLVSEKTKFIPVFKLAVGPWSRHSLFNVSTRVDDRQVEEKHKFRLIEEFLGNSRSTSPRSYHQSSRRANAEIRSQDALHAGRRAAARAAGASRTEPRAETRCTRWRPLHPPELPGTSLPDLLSVRLSNRQLLQRLQRVQASRLTDGGYTRSVDESI